MALRVLCVDDDRDYLSFLRLELGREHELLLASTWSEVRSMLSRESVDAVLLDVDLGYENGLGLLAELRRAHPDVDVVMLSGRHDPATIVQAMRAGAADYLSKAADVEEIIAALERLGRGRQTRERFHALISENNAARAPRPIIHQSKAMSAVLEQAEKLEGHNANVLIIGETGTGKELLARALHAQEGDPQRPFVALNCAAIPQELIEAELFGAERGSYTGAVARRIGKFELADGGDIFLDEVGSLRLDLQAKILRVLQEKEFCRLGGAAVLRPTFRVIAATNEHLERMVSCGQFRMDLYHRLRVIELTLPPLRDRIEDIPPLVQHFLIKHTPSGQHPKRISEEALDMLCGYAWPGNVRELENVIQGMIILTRAPVIEPKHLPSWALRSTHKAVVDMPTLPTVSESDSLRKHLQRAERQYISAVLSQHCGDKAATARALGMGRTTLYVKLRELGLTD